MKMVLLHLVIGIVLAVTMSVDVLAAGDAAAGQQKSATCVACHGPNGAGFFTADGTPVNPVWPKLAGQSPHYIPKQLQDFQAQRRVNDIMQPMIAALTEPDIEDLAAFFSSRSASAGDVKATAKGKNIYVKGNIQNRVLACTGCHGMDGRGNGERFEEYLASANLMAPALAGQFAPYVTAQLKSFRAGDRTNDVGKVMQNIAKEMTDDEIEAVAQYIESL